MTILSAFCTSKLAKIYICYDPSRLILGGLILQQTFQQWKEILNECEKVSKGYCLGKAFFNMIKSSIFVVLVKIINISKQNTILQFKIQILALLNNDYDY